MRCGDVPNPVMAELPGCLSEPIITADHLFTGSQGATLPPVLKNSPLSGTALGEAAEWPNLPASFTPP